MCSTEGREMAFVSSYWEVGKKTRIQEIRQCYFLTCWYTSFHGLLKQFLGFCNLTSRISGKKLEAMAQA